ncbi:hypothetical protein PTSG_03588 [Salpingoeca rosetta]|uniref:Uncharacterized protein n=1 Tax=Salpingoeca rosetta (strain ATCC 50818 / BSB-021) TaxID=946362 RepID=F2U612_SALR5|nr:uncharacterized protein PTSG_03588 [Salpingoeca rosetta]EGD82953.1 hypothetical protein PTSG_03588 [Salpingoeca rosetta]|eukprot:XP_004995317.1 hypothetical protein PTSG_03588 [Salpingoeca rosetta]
MDDDDDIGWEDLHKPTYFVYGGLFVLSYETLFYPLDFLKTRQQYERTPTTIASIASGVYRREGVRGLFRGFGATLAGNFPGQVVYFGAYEMAKHASFTLARKWNDNSDSSTSTSSTSSTSPARPATTPTAPSADTASAIRSSSSSSSSSSIGGSSARDGGGIPSAAASAAAQGHGPRRPAAASLPANPDGGLALPQMSSADSTVHITSTQRFIGNLFAGFVADLVCLLVYTPADIVAQRHMVATAAAILPSHSTTSPSPAATAATPRRSATALSPTAPTTTPLQPTSSTSAAASTLTRPAPIAPSLHAQQQQQQQQRHQRQHQQGQHRLCGSTVSARGERAHVPDLPTTRQLVRSIVKQEGFRGFYRGYWASVATFAPSSAIWFAVYELCKFKLAHMWPTAAPNAATLNHLASGAVAGFAATVIMNPFDVAKTRLQTLDAGIKEEAALIRRGFVSLLLWTIRSEGVAAVMKGLGPRLWFSVPGSAITFAGYEWAKSLANVSKDKE